MSLHDRFPLFSTLHYHAIKEGSCQRVAMGLWIGVPSSLYCIDFLYGLEEERPPNQR
jgi:hypothetical protein